MPTMNSLSDVYENAIQQYEKLHRQGKLKDEQLAMIKSRTSIGDILKDVGEAKAKNESERNVVMRLIHRVTPDFVSKLERVSKTVEVAISAKPEFAALVWSGIKFVVLISQDIFDTYGKACDIVEKISLCLERFDVYYEVYGVTTLLGSRFVTFYGDIMDFCLKTIEFYTRGKLRTLGASIWRSLSEPFDEILRKIVSHTDEIDKAASAELMKMARDGFQSQGDTSKRCPALPTIQNIYGTRSLASPLHWSTQATPTDQPNVGKLTPNPKRVSVFGMPGVGKSQLALRHAHENRDSYTNVFYAQATGKDQLILDYEKICALLQLPECTSFKPEPKVEGVKRWLINSSDWLIIFDNVVHVATVREFLPAGATGSIIFTMRDAHAAEELGVAGNIQLLPMEESDGIKLILKVSELSGSYTEPEARSLASELNRELGGLRLALEQGVAFSNHCHWPLSKYIDQLRTQKAKILKSEAGGGGANPSNFYSSFTLAVKGITPEAVILLKILSHLYHQDVPLELFERGADEVIDFLDGLQRFSASVIKRVISKVEGKSEQKKSRRTASPPKDRYSSRKATYRIINLSTIPGGDAILTTLQHLFSDMSELEKAISCLQASALIQRKGNGNLWMHDLVRDLSSDLITVSEKKMFAAATIILVDGAFPPQILENYQGQRSEPFAPHVASSFRHVQLQELRMIEGYRAIFTLACYYRQGARYDEALALLESELAGGESTLDQDQLDNLIVSQNMALVFSNEGRYSKALEWYESALGRKRKVFGKVDLEGGDKVYNAAWLFGGQNTYIKDLGWYRFRLYRKEKVLDHTVSLPAIYNMALVFDKQKEDSKALEWYERALAGKEKALGKDHPDTLATVHNMALVFNNQGEYSKALEWYERALAGGEKVLGKDHPNTLATVHSMASVFDKQGEYSKALEWYERALAGKEKALGNGHPDTAKTARRIQKLRDGQKVSKEAAVVHKALISNPPSI